ncbi:MAG: RecQ family ATP-dependent DNA helicase, partial [Deltaproteobacteria bacterium]|nr:RecQ family ATP-dependent DNA helicase [Deltaproteobacteria bacterium]
RELTAARSLFLRSPCIALTATATPRVRADIKTNLKMDGCREFIASFNRENLFLQVKPKYDPVQQTIRFLRRFPDQSGIIYCHSRKQVEDLNAALEDEGFAVKPYHAGMSDELRSENQELFIRDDIQIMVATIAFGMGIDKPNVRFIIHFDLPQNIESYYQQIGRAGRDGLRSHCLLLFSYADVQKIKYFINQKQVREQRVANLHLSALLRFAESQDCRRIPLLNYFAEDYAQKTCNMCDNCLSEDKEQIDITIAAQKFLSCVKRTGENFGAHHIVDVLRGSQARKVINFGHDRLSTYGIGKEYSKKQWLQLSRQFLHHGLIIQDMEVGNLRLSDKAWRVMKSQEKVFGRLDEEQAEETPVLESLDQEAPEYDRGFFELLRKHRKTMADDARVPPFVIFSDRSLIEMATYFPQTREQFLDIHGVGAVKYERYGEQFLDLICRYCREHGIDPLPKKSSKPSKPKPKKVKTDKAPKLPQKPRYVLVAEAYNEGDAIDVIMDRYGIKQGTVYDHLLKYLLAGEALRPDGLLSSTNLPSDQIEQVLDAFSTVGTDYLKPAYDALDGRIDYEDLRVLRVYHLSLQPPPPPESNIDHETDSHK